jgi:hypothetical protein
MKNCNCIPKVVEAVKKAHDLSDEDELEKHGIGHMMSSGAITYTFFKWRKNGKRKWEGETLVHNYCPFCGRKVR